MLRTLSTIALLALAVTAQAAMYKWVDENGITQFSQYPPKNQPAEKLRPPPPPAMAPEEAQQQLQQKLDAFNERRNEQQEAATEASKEAEKQAIRKQNCETARRNLQALQNAGGRRITGPDGTPIFPTDEQREAKKAEARKAIEKNCN